MVNTSLKKLKHHLAGFDVVVKERTTTTTITEGTWGFEHTKACFRDEIIPFVKALKDLFNTFNQYLIDELSEVQNVFHQMEQAVEQHRLESKTFQCLKLETELLNKKDFIEKEIYNKLLRSYTTLEKHCISLEVDTQLNQEIFQRDNSVSNQSASSFDQYFELNELKAQSQEKDTVINKLKERIKSLSGNMNEDNIKKDIEETKTINIKLDHRVSKLIAENDNLKQTYKQLYDSIKLTRIRSKEQCDALINQVNQKSMEISDLNASLQEKVMVSITLKNELRKLKGKDLANNVVTKSTIDPEMLKINVEPIAPRLLNNRTAHSDYLRHTQEQAAIFKEIVEQGKSQNPLNNSLDYACKYTKRIQELLIIISQTYPSINNSGDKLVAVTPKNKDKRVRFTEPVASSGNTNIKITSSSNLVSKKPILSSTRVKLSTSASGSQPSGNTKKDKIQQTLSSTQKNKVEAHSRTVKSSVKNKNYVEPKGSANVQNSKLNANFEMLCVKCNGCMLSDNHDLCVLNFINDANAHAKSKSVQKSSKRKVWKPTRKVFINIGYIWRPTGRIFTIVENVCPLTRITKTTEVPLRKPAALKSDTPKLVATLVYSRKPKKSKTDVPISKPKIIKSISANNKEPSKSWGSIVSDVPSSSLNECRLSKLFSDMMASSPICLLSKASKTKSWLWHRRLSHLNFGAINHLARHSLVRGLPKLKFKKDHLYSTCAIGKSKKKPYKPKSEDTNQEKLYLLHMDLCGPMRVASVNGKKHILVIVDNYSRFTWVKCLRLKDEAPDFIIKFLKMIQKVGISHETFVAFSPQQNCVVERRNRTLIEAGRTMLIYAKAPLFLWAEAVATACYTQNRSIIQMIARTWANYNRSDIGIFIGYAPTKKAFRIYNRCTRRIIETIHVDFDELTEMASAHSSLGPVLYEMTPATISSGLMPNPPPPSTPFVPPSRTDWDILFQPLFDKLLNPPSSVDRPVPEVIAPIAEVVAPSGEPARSYVQNKVMVFYFKKDLSKVKLDELGGTSKTKARLVARWYRPEEGIDFEDLCSSG
ncbi:retrovirus-related pol polyprotein from transposon TNT 1-94 [Tanacetum coccineum]